MTNRKSTPIKGVTSAEEDTRDRQLVKLFFFEVDESGTLTESDFKEPKINSDLFDNISLNRLTTPKTIIDEVECYDALVEHFRWLARDEQEKLIHRMELQDYRDDQEHLRMKRLAEELEDEDEGWKKWINTEGDEKTPRFTKVIVDWLAAPIEWTEDMPDNATAQDSAKRFFEHEDIATLNELGVSIVEGESPGSTYYAAELNKTVEEANEIAQKLRLSYRFRENRKGAA
jgi:hypothetical protein